MLNKLSLVLASLNVIIGRFAICSAVNAQYANPNIPTIAKYFGTKGRYEEVNPHLVDDILSVNKSNVEPPSPDCKAVHITAVLRHGTRYPSSKYIKDMKNMYGLVLTKANGTESWLRDLQAQWKMWYTEEMDGDIVEKGRDDHRHLAVRLATSFPTLISEENLRNNRFQFFTSSKHRCVASIKAFEEGLANLWKTEESQFKHEENDELMRFFDQCRRYIHDVANNRTALEEVDLFRSRPEMRRVQEKVADRLLVPYSDITTDLVDAAFLLCAYDFAIKTENSPWCRLFDEEDAQVLEYMNDLKQFWKRGYGHDINRKSSCSLFHDMFNRLDRVANETRFGEVTEAVTVQMGHAETLLPLLTLLGLFQDELPLNSSNYAAQRSRAFRSGLVVPYAANLVLVLYDCQAGLRLQALLNERPLPFPNIPHPAPLYHTVKQAYQQLLQGCSFKKECELPSHT